jgi:signal transduction histidine kinase
VAGHPQASAGDADFAEYWASLTRRRAAALALLFAVSVLAGWPSDAYVFAGEEEAVDLMGRWRGATLVCALLAAPFLRPRSGPTGSWLVFLAFGAAAAAIAGHFLARVDAIRPTGFFHAAYLVPFGPVLLVLPLGPRVAMTAGVTGSYLLSYFAAMPAADPPHVGASVTVSTVFAVFAGVAVGHIHFGLVRTTFFQRVELARHAAELEARVAERTSTLRRLASYLERSREDERKRVVQALHDDTAQLLTGMRLEVSSLRGRAAEDETLGAALDRVEELILRTMKAEKRLIRSLRPKVLDDAGLGPALRTYLDEVGAQAELRLRYEDELGDAAIEPAIATVAYRIVQEAVTNVLRHACASSLEVRVGWTRAGRLSVVIEDDGVGFEPDLPRAESFGLVGMRERVDELGGTLELSSAEGAGTRITMELDADARAAEPIA